jgi:glycosyltransferase involved in cell wall biosynthesis
VQTNSTAARLPQIGIIIPACNEEECIGQVLDELLAVLDPEKFIIAVGVNDSSDRTAEIARERPVVVAETAQQGYGFGCQRAIDHLSSLFPSVRAYLFCAGDGASDPVDIVRIAAACDQGYDFVLGTRTTRLAYWRAMTFPHFLANFGLGIWSGMLGGRWFTDLGPLRIIDRDLFERIAPREMTFGWTIEVQIVAAKCGAEICEIPVRERLRLGGRQKVSGVSWHRTFAIGCQIVAAGFRTGMNYRSHAEPAALVFEERSRSAEPQRES